METNIWGGSTCWIWSTSWSKDEERFMRGDLHLGHGKRDFWKWKRIIPKAIGHFQRNFHKTFFPREKHVGLSSNKKKEPPRPKSSLGVNPKQNTCHKKNYFERESSLGENFKSPPSNQIKVWKSQIKFWVSQHLPP